MNFVLIALVVATFLSTLIGGTIAIKFKNYLPLFFAFSAGSLIGVSFFDILPELLQIANSISFEIRNVFAIIVAAFFFYHLLERYFLTHHDDSEEHGHVMGSIGAGSLILHSFFDGIAIGVAFQVNAGVGLIIALAVIMHDFTDGINTVTIMLRNKNDSKKAFKFLLFGAIAPVVGALLTTLVKIPESVLVLILPIFIGEFLYIGASSLLPETHKHPGLKMPLSVAAGMILIYILTSLV